MTLRKILVPLVGGSLDAGALENAALIAKSVPAHMEGLFVRPDPSDTLPFMGEGVAGPVIQDIINAASQAADNAETRARESLSAAASKHGIDLVEAASGPSGASASLTLDAGPFAAVVAHHAILSDLVIFQSAKDEDEGFGLGDALQQVLMGVGRPILLAPQQAPSSIGKIVTIGWDGSAESALAVREAMPFLRQAQRIQILTVSAGRKNAALADRMAAYLACHGLSCIEHVVDPQGRPVGEVLQAEAASSGSDLLVVGGYGHGRLREFILGGATRHLLTKTSVPVLMVH